MVEWKHHDKIDFIPNQDLYLLWNYARVVNDNKQGVK